MAAGDDPFSWLPRCRGGSRPTRAAALVRAGAEGPAAPLLRDVPDEVAAAPHGAKLGGMATPARRPATYDDLLRVPPHRVAEIVDGDLHVSPRPAFRHALASSALGADLWAPFHRGRGGPGGWWLLFEPELHLGPDVLVPDLAGWRRERMPQLPDVASCTLAPDWICEVVSPSTEGLDRAKKMPTYARESVGHLWLVSPLARTLEVYRLSQGRWLLLATHEGTARVRAEPFEAVELELATLWGEEPLG
jgi:Uma2 family endonuclease